MRRYFARVSQVLFVAAIAFVAITIAIKIRTPHSASPEHAFSKLWSRSTSSLIPDKYTVMLSTYNRDATLKMTLSEINEDETPSLHEIIVVWHDPKRDPPSDVLEAMKALKVPATLRRPVTDSLNNRFLPGDDIKTVAVMSRDDDLRFGPGDVEFQFKQWLVHGQDQLVGTAPRQVIRVDGTETRWEYRMKDLECYHIILTNAAFFHGRFLQSYWADNLEAKAARDVVDVGMNCEDIAMSFFVANTTGKPPLLVETKEPRRYYRKTGFSSSPTHFQDRSMCYQHFVDIFGFHLPPATEVVKRSGSALRDWWDSIPPPPEEADTDSITENQQKHLDLMVKEIAREKQTLRQREDEERAAIRKSDENARVVQNLRRRIEELEDRLRHC